MSIMLTINATFQFEMVAKYLIYCLSDIRKAAKIMRISCHLCVNVQPTAADFQSVTSVSCIEP
jgi:hypothetical protein